MASKLRLSTPISSPPERPVRSPYAPPAMLSLACVRRASGFVSQRDSSAIIAPAHTSTTSSISQKRSSARSRAANTLVTSCPVSSVTGGLPTVSTSASNSIYVLPPSRCMR